ncbi:hypothetical protein A6M27_20855 [Acidithiobacillus thiooxidans]|uniref:hypothetical protein n=2 Tax=Acidithiobacillus thiooxidans TaxID=930 RepID=UPI0004671D84|nr:hypothetical protein [Acidithiobacillus thiooxidans]OCX79269.1 hypothetical protein A6O26_16935 [Acidithiobacillus thiooxidans]OCX80491.1 hypothetical protein A6M27_20855 [Acidithiobacillus thiooxidans]OFC48739.1 hypothetical protein BAE47_06875 [Acidithiobacillus thiooxidans]
MSQVSYVFQWTCLEACQVLGVWPGAENEWIQRSSQLRDTDLAQTTPLWTNEEGFSAAKIRSATEFLLQLTPDERMQAFRAEIGKPLAQVLETQLAELFKTGKQAGPLS